MSPLDGFRSPLFFGSITKELETYRISFPFKLDNRNMYVLDWRWNLMIMGRLLEWPQKEKPLNARKLSVIPRICLTRYICFLNMISIDRSVRSFLQRLSSACLIYYLSTQYRSVEVNYILMSFFIYMVFNFLLLSTYRYGKLERLLVLYV